MSTTREDEVSFLKDLNAIINMLEAAEIEHQVEDYREDFSKDCAHKITLENGVVFKLDVFKRLINVLPEEEG